MMKSIPNKAATALLTASAWAGSVAVTTAHAVNDLPGGPAVRQLNLHSVHRDFPGGFRSHVLFDLETP